MPATSTVKEVHQFTDPLSSKLMRENNPDLYSTNMPRMYPIHRFIHIYSVARKIVSDEACVLQRPTSGLRKG